MKYKIVILVLILLTLLFAGLCSFAKSTAISKSPEVDVYNKYKKIIFSGKGYILKYSYYSDVSKDYSNEYYRRKENKSNWTDKIIVDNFIMIKDPVDYAYKIANSYKDGVVLYQRKYSGAIVCYSKDIKRQGVSVMQITVQKLQLNPYAPGILSVTYIYNEQKQIKSVFGTSEDLKKLIKDKYVFDLLEFKAPSLCRISVCVK